MLFNKFSLNLLVRFSYIIKIFYVSFLVVVVMIFGKIKDDFAFISEAIYTYIYIYIK